MSPVSFSQNKAAPADGGLVQGIPFKMFLFYEELYVGLPLKILVEHHRVLHEIYKVGPTSSKWSYGAPINGLVNACSWGYFTFYPTYGSLHFTQL